MPAATIVLTGLKWTGKVLVGGSVVGLVLFIPDAIALTDWVGRTVFGKELCLQRGAKNAILDLKDFLFDWSNMPLGERYWKRLCAATMNGWTFPGRGLEFEAVGDNVILFTYGGRFFSCGVMQLPRQEDACGPITHKPQFAVWVQPADFRAYEPNLPAEIADAIRPKIRIAYIPDAPLPQPVEFYFGKVAKAIGVEQL